MILTVNTSQEIWMSACYTHPAACTRSAWCVVRMLSTSCQNNENQSAPTVQGLGCTPGLSCQVGKRADEQKEIDSGRRAGVEKRGIDGQPEIHRHYSKGNLARQDGHPSSGEMLDLH